MRPRNDQVKFQGALQDVRIDCQPLGYQHHPLPPNLRHPQHNIHLNPHFRPRAPPFNQPVWQGPQPNFNQQPFFNNQFNYNQGPPHGCRWNDEGGQFYHGGPPPDAPPPFSNFNNQFYNGGFGDEGGPPGMFDGGCFPPPPPAHPPPLMGLNWNGPPPPQPPPAPLQPPLFPPHHAPQSAFQHRFPPTEQQLLRKKPPLPTKKQRNNLQTVKHRLGAKKFRFQNGFVGGKTDKFKKSGGTRTLISCNLHEIQTVDLPPPTETTTKPEDEDEEMRTYRLKIEEQKRRREEIWRQKEQKRLEALLKNQEQARLEGRDGPDPNIPLDQQFKVVRVRTKDGKTILKRLSYEVLQKLKKISPADSTTSSPPEGSGSAGSADLRTRIVLISNLSASTTQKQLLDMGKMVGAVKSIKLDSLAKSATMSFETAESALAFQTKFQRKMVDLSMISVTLVVEEPAPKSAP